MADGNAQILRQLGPHWLECLDEQGIFYFNQVTQQSSDTLPAELMGGQPAAQPIPVQAKIVQQPPSYTPPPQVSSYTPPPQTGPQVYAHSGHATPPMQPGHMYPQAMQQQASYQPHLQPQFAQPQMQPPPFAAQQFGAGQPPPMPPQQHPQMQQFMAQQQQHMRPMQAQPPAHMQPVMPQQQPAVQKMQFGDWAVYEDDLGRFYMHVPSGQQFEAPPPELMQAYQQYRAEQDQQHLDQLRQIELQKQQIDQRLHQQTQVLQQQYHIHPAACGA